MAMAVTAFQSFAETKHEGIDLETEAVNLSLSNTVPDAANDSVWADLSADDLAAGNGYTAGGFAITKTSSQTSGTYELEMTANLVITASGGSIGPFQYAVLRAVTSGILICYYTFDSAITLSDGESRTVQAAVLYSDAPAA